MSVSCEHILQLHRLLGSCTHRAMESVQRAKIYVPFKRNALCFFFFLTHFYCTRKIEHICTRNVAPLWLNQVSIWFERIVVLSFRISFLPDGTLRITNVTKMDGGNYACLARNQFGAASTTGRLLVTGKDYCNSITVWASSLLFLQIQVILDCHSAVGMLCEKWWFVCKLWGPHSFRQLCSWHGCTINQNHDSFLKG